MKFSNIVHNGGQMELVMDKGFALLIAMRPQYHLSRSFGTGTFIPTLTGGVFSPNFL